MERKTCETLETLDREPRRQRPRRVADVRDRWRMGAEARGLVLVSAVLTAFGLAVLYSASAMVGVHDYNSSAYFLLRQIGGVAVGMVAFAIVAKLDADKLSEWAWPIMWVTIVAMFLVLVLPASYCAANARVQAIPL